MHREEGKQLAQMAPAAGGEVFTSCISPLRDATLCSHELLSLCVLGAHGHPLEANLQFIPG